MTGLDFDNDSILEVAVLVTNHDLTPVDDGLEMVIHKPDEALENMDEWNTKTHTESGLVERSRASTLDEAQAEQQVLAYLQAAEVPKQRGLLCGNSICTDRRFLYSRMSELDQYLHYRMIDISSIKELAKRWRTDLYDAAPEKTSRHRALDDIRETLEELRYYRANWLV